MKIERNLSYALIFINDVISEKKWLYMTNYLIERIKFAKNNLSPVLKNDLINAGQEIVKPIIKLLPSMTSYVVTADLLETMGCIGGNDSFNALNTILEDAPPGNLPVRLISQSCIKGLGFIGDQKSLTVIIKALSFTDPELRYVAVKTLSKLYTEKPEYKNQIIDALRIALANETYQKTGVLLEDTLERFGQTIIRRQSWPKVETITETINPVKEIQYPQINITTNQITDNTHQANENPDTNTINNSLPQVSSLSNISNKYSFLDEQQQQEILDKLLTSPDENEKLQIISELAISGNIEVIDELLTVIKSTDNSKLRMAAVDAILSIAPNDIKLKFLVLEYLLERRVIGQHKAKVALANALRVAQIGLKKGSNSNKPIGSFLFLGPTGVGKTELAKALAEALYGTELKLIRIDMSEYTDMSDKNKLIGSPPGFVGSEEGGRLTQAVLKQPQSVVLFDEIEKAHNEIFNLFLQLLDDGRLTDSKGITVSFGETIVIMTSNVGSEYILQGLNAKLSMDEIKEIVKESLKEKFKPEFLNRLNDNIIFKPLTTDELHQVLNLKLIPTSNILKSKYQLSFDVSKPAQEFIIQKTIKQEFGFSPRELARILDEEIVQPLSEMLLDYEIAETYQKISKIPRGGIVTVELKDSNLVIEMKSAQTLESTN